MWWPDYAEVNLTDEGRHNYSVQLDLRIIPKWGDHALRHLEARADRRQFILAELAAADWRRR